MPVQPERLLSADVAGSVRLIADPAAMDGIGQRLHDIALTDGHQEVANAMTYAFGGATSRTAKGDHHRSAA
ncbi:hypothetical protein [Streptomyces sp. CB00455]|uniref:hypothetical protein n=1 Tax=Streptomyces sp. CB00455 TaxID=1703927 RepID=UPI0018FEA564|nr:hypothetical protein [Streptomyces sp. CB00455]